MEGLLAGTVIAEALYPLLDDVCVAVNILGESKTDASIGMSEFMADQHDPHDPQRLWWTYTNAPARRVWISINPGEFRTKPPEPPCIVKELPPTAPRISSRRMLELGLASAQLLPPATPAERRSVATAERLLKNDTDGALAELGRACRQALLSPDMPSYQAAIDALYEGLLQDLAWPAVDFSAIVLLVQIQAALNTRIDEDWTSRPGDFVSALVRTLIHDGSSRARALDLLNDIAIGEFDSGRQEVRNAVHGNMAGMGRALTLAWQRFLTAHLIVKSLIAAGIPAHELPLMPNIADEAAAWTITGIRMRARFAMLHPQAEALDLAARANLNFDDLHREAVTSASELNPTFTRFFAEVLAAQALSLAAEPQAKEQACRELERLRAVVGGERTLEADWIDHALLNVLRSLGRTEQAQAIATSIAVRMMLRTTPPELDH